jgi:uncharacterized RDD family membrane protein YckC
MANGEAFGYERNVGVGLRFVAFLIDSIVFLILGYVMAALTGGTTADGFGLQGVPFFIFSLLSFLYYWLMETYLGGTLGKLVLGMRVIMEDGEPVTLTASLVRNLLRIVDGLPGFLPYLLGAIFIWTSPAKQRLGDRLAKTYVVKK